MEYLAYCTNDGYTFLNGVDKFNDFRQVFAFDEILNDQSFSYNDVKEKIQKASGYLIRRKKDGPIENAEKDVQQYSVKGIERGCDIYLSRDFSGIVYKESSTSKIYIHANAKQKGERTDDYFLRVRNLMPDGYLSSPFNEAIGVPLQNYALLSDGYVQKVDLDFVSGLQADYFAFKEGQLLGAYGIKAQTCVMLPLPNDDCDDRTVKTVAKFLTGFTHTFSKNGEQKDLSFCSTIGLLTDPDSGVIFNEQARTSAERLVNVMRNGFKDATGKIVDLDLSWCQKRLRPPSSGSTVDGELLYMFRSQEQLDQAFASEKKGGISTKADAYVYVFDKCDTSTLDSDIARTIAGEAPIAFTGLLVNAGVNAILREAYSIYDKALTQALGTMNDLLFGELGRIEADLQGVWDEVMSSSLNSILSSIMSVDSGKSIVELVGDVASRNSDGTHIWQFALGIKPTLPNVLRPESYKDSTEALNKMYEVCGIIGKTLLDVLPIMDSDASQDMLDAALANLPPGVITPEMLSNVNIPKIPMPACAMREVTEVDGIEATVIRPAIQKAIGDAQLSTLLGDNGELTTVMQQICDVVNAVKFTEFKNHKNNVASRTEQWLLTTQTFSRQLLPDPLRLDEDAKVTGVSVVGTQSEWECAVTFEIALGSPGQQGVGTGSQLFSTFMGAITEWMQSEEGLGLNITGRYLGKLKSLGASPTHKWRFTDIPTGIPLCYHMTESGLNYDGVSVNEKPKEVSKVEFRWSVARSASMVYDLGERLGLPADSAIVKQMQSAAEGIAAIPFVFYIAHHSDTLKQVAEMEPIGFAQDTYLTPKTMKAFYNCNWSDGVILTDAEEEEDPTRKHTGVLGAALNVLKESLVTQQSDAGHTLYRDVKSVLLAMQTAMIGSMSAPVTPVYWLTEVDFFGGKAINDVGVLPLYIDFCVG